MSSLDPAKAVEPGPEITPELFYQWRSPRVGAQNPECLTNPVWNWLVRSRASAYSASARFGGREDGDPGWSFARHGQSETRLDDGRVVYIAGEHEDHYDPDFYIYNDVVIRYPDDRIDVFAYPLDVFPPTDFHSATLAGNRILVVGNLGYPEGRQPGRTQIVSIDLARLSSSLIESSGDAPGWIHDHTAVLDGDGALVVSGGKVVTGRGAGLELRENGDDWRLDLASMRWSRLSDRQWRSWQVSRADRQAMHLWRVRSLAQFKGVRWGEEHRDSMEAMIEEQTAQVRMAYGADPDLELFASLYSPALVHAPVPDDPEEFGVHRIHVDGIVVRYVERTTAVKIVVEGRLRGEILSALVEDLRHKLASLEHTEYIVTEL